MSGDFKEVDPEHIKESDGVEMATLWGQNSYTKAQTGEKRSVYFKKIVANHSTSEVKAAMFKSKGEVDSGSVAAKAEDILPSVESMSKAVDSWVKEGRPAWAADAQIPALERHDSWAGSAAHKIKNSIEVLASRANLVLSFALKPPKSGFDLGANDWRHGIESGPLAQAYEKKFNAGMDVAGTLLPSQRLFDALREVEPGFYDDSYLSSHYVEHLLASVGMDGEKYERVLGLSVSYEKQKMMHQARRDGKLTQIEDTTYYRKSESIEKTKELEYESGAGFSGLAQTLKAASPVLGVSQWAVAAVKVLRESSYYVSKYEREKLASESQKALGDALESFESSLCKAQAAFVRLACAKALEVQTKWLDQNKFLSAWSQAGLTGNHTPRSVAWAQQNPSKAIQSSEPMERLAAGAARGLGLKTDDAGDLAPALNQELEQLGLGSAGWALLTKDSECRGYVLKMLSQLTAKNNAVREAKSKLSVACKALEAAARAGLGEEDASIFCQILAPNSENEDMVRYGKSALEEGFRELTLKGPVQARLADELGQAKKEQLQGVFDALARDWGDGVQEAKNLGVEKQSRQEIKERGSKLASMAHEAFDLDWRKRPFESMDAWEVFGLASHKMAPILARAKLTGDLEAWAAGLASRLGIVDVSDVNGLVGKTKEACKQRWGMSDGAWKLAIKSKNAMEALESAIMNSCGGGDGYLESAGLLSSMTLSRQDKDILSGTKELETSSDFFYAAGLAAAQGASPEALGGVLFVLSERGGGESLFSRSIDSENVSDEDGAFFFRQEAEAKAGRMPKLFQEMCKRWQKFEDDFKAASQQEGLEVLPANEAFSGEVADLCDWIENSEMGLWQNLPKEPTWGQLRRMSKLWHDEQQAIELDRLARKKAKFQEECGTHRLNPFAPRATEHWEPIVGNFKRDGWEAVELTSQAELTEEGVAMKHCVSTYAPVCREGELRIFSIRLDGERKCTMEVRSGSKALVHLPSDAKFNMTQNKGKHNAEVTSPATRAFCKETLTAVDVAWTKKHGKIQELRRLEEEKAKAEKERLPQLKKAASAEAQKGVKAKKPVR